MPPLYCGPNMSPENPQRRQGGDMWASILSRRQSSAPPPLTIHAPWAWPSWKKTAIKVMGVSGLLFVLMVGLALGGDRSGGSTGTAADVIAQTAGSPTAAEMAAEIGHVKISLNMFFLIFGGALVFFMQAGFALVETGFCRSKNAVHVIMTNFVIFAIGTIVYWAMGYAFQFGGAGSFATLGATEPLGALASVAPDWGVIGYQGFFLAGKSYDVAIVAMFFFRLVFMDPAATIPTGGMAERWKFSAFVVYGAFISAILYPIYGSWVWGGGWLAALGRNLGIGHGAIDFAGSGVVHGVNGVWGLIALGLFADGSYGAGWNGVEGTVRGLFYGGGAGQLAAQAIDAAVVFIWAFGLMYIFFRIQKRIQGIRVTRDEEMIGLDIPEMGVPAYPASPH